MFSTKFPLILLVLTTLTCFSIPIFAHAHNTPSIDDWGFTHQTTGVAITDYKATFEDPNDSRMGTHFHVSGNQVLAFKKATMWIQTPTGNVLAETADYEHAPRGQFYVSDPELDPVGSTPTVRVTGDSNEDGRNDNTPESGIQVTFEFTDSNDEVLDEEKTFTDDEGKATITTLPDGTHSITASVEDLQDEQTKEDVQIKFNNTTLRNFLTAINADPPTQSQLNSYDYDNDNDIDGDDLILWIDQQNAAPAAAQTPHEWLQHMKELDNPDPAWQLAIQLLEEHLIERRLLEPAPKKTVLLANYPNPFNPETWIPYRLAKAADVTLTIYATNGQPIRSLTLGHQPAGNYVNRARAAYWDGKNAFGESVASGVYFYALTTDDFSATRKMLVAK